MRWEEVRCGAGVKANSTYMPMYELPVAGQMGTPLCHAAEATHMRHTGYEGRDCFAGQSYLSK
jgi:hypothetical protein